MGETPQAHSQRTMVNKEKTRSTRIPEACLFIHAHIDFDVMGSSE